MDVLSKNLKEIMIGKNPNPSVCEYFKEAQKLYADYKENKGYDFKFSCVAQKLQKLSPPNPAFCYPAS